MLLIMDIIIFKDSGISGMIGNDSQNIRKQISFATRNLLASRENIDRQALIIYNLKKKL